MKKYLPLFIFLAIIIPSFAKAESYIFRNNVGEPRALGYIDIDRTASWRWGYGLIMLETPFGGVYPFVLTGYNYWGFRGYINPGFDDNVKIAYFFYDGWRWGYIRWSGKEAILNWNTPDMRIEQIINVTSVLDEYN